MPTKRVEPGDWRTLESTLNVKCIACFRAPAGVRIKISKWLFSQDEQVLDGTNYKKLILTWGKVQVRVPQTADITYSWEPMSGKPATSFPTIHF